MEDTFDDRHELRYSTPNKAVQGLNRAEAAQDALNFVYDLRKEIAKNAVLDAIKDQLAPGQTVDVFMADFDFSSGGFQSVTVDRPAKPFVSVQERIVRVRLTSTKPGLAQPTESFKAPTASGPQVVKLPTESPSEARPGAGDLRDFYDRWNKDPGTFDLDMDHYHEVSNTA